ncbi:MAG: hypothetical protein H0X50_03925 [Nitrosopumilus sp.]|jgi:hypothetical protein|nr:hypothetical protein [Nitrosopumilus sp.]
MQNQNTNAIFAIAVIMTAFTAVLQFGSANLAFSQEVPLLPINTGNETLDISLPVFYECIEEAVDASENAPQQDSYFEDEPTKNEVRACYQAVFIDNPVEEENNNDEDEEDDE